MAELIRMQCKGHVLTHPTLRCLAPYHTINLTAGCPCECRYCYAQSFRSYPGRGKVKFYANTLELLRDKLPRKRARPKLVYFSTACEPFMPYDEILDCLFGCMGLLLEDGCELLISTKARIPRRFLDLFARYPGKVHVQVGVTTVDDAIRELLEPHASAVAVRLGTLKDLVQRHVDCEARMDPLVPLLTDTADRFDATVAAIASQGVSKAVASYLFLRRANYRRLSVRYREWSFEQMAAQLYTGTIKNYCGNNDIRVADLEYRKLKYPELQRIADRHTVSLGLCACKNPDYATTCCHPVPGVDVNANSIQPRLF